MPRRTVVFALGLALCVAACHSYTPLKVSGFLANRDPVVQSLVAFPTTLHPGDSAAVVCGATDPDGDTLFFDWYSDCRMLITGDVLHEGSLSNQTSPALVVHAGGCNRAPTDTGWVSCEVRDGRGGGAYAGTVRIIVKQ